MKIQASIDQPDYDVLIVGGGLVGMSLALGLKNRLHSASLKVGLIDPTVKKSNLRSSDQRTIALNILNCKILEKLTALDCNDFLGYPIENIHVSKEGKFAITRLKASEVGLSVLGYSIEIATLMESLEKALVQTDCVLISDRVQNVYKDNKNWKIELETGDEVKQLSARLLIAADGDNSFLRKMLSIPAHTKDYAESAMITTVASTKPHENTAFERFVGNGSIALLPIAEQKFKLVWIASTELIKSFVNQSESEIFEGLKIGFGKRIGQFHTLGSERLIYPLRRVQVEKQVQNGFVLMGNAAHALHPIAAQGFNLSLREIAVFIDVLDQAIKSGKDFSSEECLQGYFGKCFFDQKRTLFFTESLASFFSKDSWVANRMFSGFVNALESIPFLKRQLIYRMMGVGEHLPSWVF